eukprot:XP_027305915.1 COX assembly mitochondrial protein homolog [Anas platyrhynchos]
MEPPPGAAENSKLRHVEKDVLIPVIMRDRAKELCSDKVQGWIQEKPVQISLVLPLFKNNKIPATVSVRNVNQQLSNGIGSDTSSGGASLRALVIIRIGTYLFHILICNTVFCLSCSYSDPSFYEECKTEYLKQREEYRATGIKKKKQKITSNI